MTVLATSVFSVIAHFLKTHSGLMITPEKIYLLEHRWMPILRSHGLASLELAADHIQRGQIPEALASQLVEAMTTNESMFFRDSKPFSALTAHMLPSLYAQGVGRIRLWSAAASHGQEPYSMAMQLAEEMPEKAVDILATDIASNVLARAKLAIYSQFEVQRGLPVKLLLRYFNQREKNSWQLGESIRSRVMFEVQNLLEPFAMRGMFHIIFCRYVLIYFDEHTRAEVLARLYQQLAPGGYLCVGATETLQVQGLTPVHEVPGLYRKI